MADDKSTSTTEAQNADAQKKAEAEAKAREYIKNQQINVTLEPDKPKNKRMTLADIQNMSQNISRMAEQAFVQENTGASMGIRKDGQINLAAAKYAQMKVAPNGLTEEVSLQSNLVTNRRNMTIDDLIINNHKMNPNLYEYSDYKQVRLPSNNNAIVGGFCVEGSMMVKAWEKDLHRYMMIRRPCRMPMFGVTLNVPGILPGLAITDPLNFEAKIDAYSTSGYQVNGKISDSKSLIGKEGVDRDGINRSADALTDAAGGATTVAAGGSPAGNIVNMGENAATIAKFLKGKGYNNNAIAGILGRLQQEHSFDTSDVPLSRTAEGYEVGGTGIMQWTHGRADSLRAYAQSIGKPVDSIEAQLGFFWEQDLPGQSPFGNFTPENLNQMSAHEVVDYWTDNYERGARSDNDHPYTDAWLEQLNSGWPDKK